MTDHAATMRNSNQCCLHLPCCAAVAVVLLLQADRDKLRETVMQPSKQKERGFPVVVTSFETCINDRAHLQRYTWRYMILDEGQRVKNKVR